MVIICGSYVSRSTLELQTVQPRRGFQGLQAFADSLELESKPPTSGPARWFFLVSQTGTGSPRQLTLHFYKEKGRTT